MAQNKKTVYPKCWWAYQLLAQLEFSSISVWCVKYQTLQNNLMVFYKGDHTFTVRPRNSFLRHLPRTFVHCRRTFPAALLTVAPDGKDPKCHWANRYPYAAILRSNEKKQPNTRKTTDESQKLHGGWEKPDIKAYTVWFQVCGILVGKIHVGVFKGQGGGVGWEWLPRVSRNSLEWWKCSISCLWWGLLIELHA